MGLYKHRVSCLFRSSKYRDTFTFWIYPDWLGTTGTLRGLIMSNYNENTLWFGQVKRWYDSPRWRNLRKWFLSKPENMFCAICLKRGRQVVATIVDHKIPHEGNYQLFWDTTNLQGLCSSCHSGVKRIQDTHGYNQSCGADGLPTDPNHPFNK